MDKRLYFTVLCFCSAMMMACTMTPDGFEDDGKGGAGGATTGAGGTTAANGAGGDDGTTTTTTTTTTTGAGGDDTSTTGTTTTGTTTGTSGATTGSTTTTGGGSDCGNIVTYKITAFASKAESLRMEGGEVAFNAQEADPLVVKDWDLFQEVYQNQAVWMVQGCSNKSFRFNIRGWSSVPVRGAPNQDAYACCKWCVTGLSPTVSIERDGKAVSFQNNLVNGNPDGEGRNCQVNGH